MGLDVTTDSEMGPPRILLYGSEKVGKTTLGASIPGVVMVLSEDGLGKLNAPHFPVRTSIDALERDLESLTRESHQYECVVVDTITNIERLIHAEVDLSGQRGLDSFGLREKLALPIWRRVLSRLDACRASGMAIVLIGHARVDRFNDPLVGEYDRYSPRLTTTRTGDAAALIVEWCDAVLFAHHRIRATKDKDGNVTDIGPVGSGGGDRIIRTVGGPACVAGNRYSMPELIPLSWPAVLAALTGETPAAPKPETPTPKVDTPADRKAMLERAHAATGGNIRNVVSNGHSSLPKSAAKSNQPKRAAQAARR